MNILILGVFDHSGAGNALYRAINENTEHEARHVVFEQSYLKYPVDIARPDNNRLAELIAWCDVLNLHDANDYVIPDKAPPRPTITTYHGTQYRQRWAYYNYYDRKFGRLPTALCFDLVMLGPRWLPYAMPDHSHAAERDQEVFRVAHAPTSRANKNTNEVIDAMVGLPGVEFDLIEGVSNVECVARKARADLLIEEFVFGYGTGTLEGFALGIPVLCDAMPALHYFIKERLGELPYYRTPVSKIRETVALMRDNPDVYVQAAMKGRHYWETYHQPHIVAERFIEMCEEVLNGRSDEQGQVSVSEMGAGQYSRAG